MSSSGVRSMDSNHKQLVVLRCKLIIVGDACVGKTALTQVFHSGGPTYPKAYLMTVGAEFCVKQVPIPDSNIIVELYIFDCAGQSMFNQLGMNAKYYEDASAVMVVYDVASHDSLKSCGKWLEGVTSTRKASQGQSQSSQSPIIGVMVGNKKDYRGGSGTSQGDSRAEVSQEDAQRMAGDLGLSFYEASAMANDGVDEPFQYIAQEFYRRYEGQE